MLVERKSSRQDEMEYVRLLVGYLLLLCMGDHGEM